MERDYDKILAILERYISSYNARGLLMRTIKAEGLAAETLTRRDLKRCSVALKRGVGLFAEPAQRARAMSEIADFCEVDSLVPDAAALEIRGEPDIGKVRSEARRICESFGADAFTAQKVATIASELARNIVLYATGGTIEILPASDGKRRVIIRAIDGGPGIPHLSAVMSGQYKSKTGLGRGLLGTKRLASHFAIDTSPSGTRIEAEVAL